MEPLKRVETIWEGKYLRLCKQGRWEYVERTNALRGVVIVAVTDDQQLLLIEQYRVPLSQRIIELPAGMAGDIAGLEHEQLEEAAQRELREETGYEAQQFKFLVAGPSSPGMSSEVNILFLATGLRRVGLGGGDEHEDIVVHSVPLAGVQSWLDERMKKGTVVDLKVFAGLSFVAEKGWLK